MWVYLKQEQRTKKIEKKTLKTKKQQLINVFVLLF